MTDGVATNIAAYTPRAGSYDRSHPEIFNVIEQRRVRAVLTDASMSITSADRHALDFGCGSGNLTRHLRELGFEVTGADVTPAFLRLVEQRHGVPTIELAGGATDAIPEESFDLVAAYSVLHHIPDYLGTVASLITKLRHGGVLVLDHEYSHSYWNPTPELAAFRSENGAARSGRIWDPDHKRWQHLVRAALTPSRHLARYRRLRRISEEGDIHVYADDHIEWEQILEVLASNDMDLVARYDYLHVGTANLDVWRRWKDSCSDMTCVVARRR